MNATTERIKTIDTTITDDQAAELAAFLANEKPVSDAGTWTVAVRIPKRDEDGNLYWVEA